MYFLVNVLFHVYFFLLLIGTCNGRNPVKKADALFLSHPDDCMPSDNLDASGTEGREFPPPK